MSTISGKIKSKKVKNGTYGDLIVFQVGASTMSVFANDKKLTQEAKDLIRELQEGDEAEFTTYDSTGKDGKTYTNISGVIKVTRPEYGEDNSFAPPAPEVHKPEGDTKVRSMCVAYSKDLVVADKVEIGNLKAVAEELYQYIMTGL
jgi:predicted RNA-binding protein with PUA-like domain